MTGAATLTPAVQEYLEVYERAGKACSRCRGTITKVKFNKANLFMCPDCQV